MGNISVRGELSLDGSGWDKTLRQAEEGVNHLAKDTLGGLKDAIAEAFTFTAIEELTRQTIEYGEAIYNMARRVAEAPEELQKLGFALKLNGSSLEAAIMVMEKFNIAKDKVFEGGPEAARLTEDFKKLGISIDQLKDMRGAEFLIKTSEKFSGDVDPQSLVAPFREIGGKGAGELIPALRDGLREAADQAERLGQVLNGTVVTMLKKSGDDIKASKGVLVALGGYLNAWWTGAKSMTDAMGHGLWEFSKATGEFNTGERHPFARAWTAMKVSAQADIEELIAMQDKLDTPLKPLDLGGANGGEEGGESRQEKNAREAIARLQEQLARAEQGFGLIGLSNAEKILELTKRRLELQRQIEDETDPQKKLKEQIALVELKGEIKSAMVKPEHAAGIRIPSLKSDSLTHVGNFLGSSANAISSIGHETNQLLRTANAHLATLVNKISNGGGHGFDGVGVPPI